MIIRNLLYTFPFLLSSTQTQNNDLNSVRDTYKILVDLVKSKIESKDYHCIDTNKTYSIHEIFIYDQFVVIKRLLKGFGFDAIGRIFKIKYENSIPIKDLIDAIVKTLFHYQYCSITKYLKIQNKTSGQIINNLIIDKLQNINEFEIIKMNDRIQFKYEKVCTDNSYLRDILVESDSYFNENDIKKDNISLLSENGRMYINFFIIVWKKFYVFKIDIQDLNCQMIFRKQLESLNFKKYFDLYTITDFVLNLYKSKNRNLSTKKSIKIYPKRNFNIKNDFRKFKVEVKNDTITFKNLDQTFIYSFLRKKIKDKKSNYQKIHKKIYKEFVNLIVFFDKTENEKNNFKIMFYELLKREDLIKKVMYRILRNKESANYLFLIHLIGNIGLIDTSQIIYLTKTSNKNEMEIENIISNYLFDKEMIEKIIRSLEKCEDFDIKNVFATIFFLEANQMYIEYDENKSGRIPIFEKFNEINEHDDLYTIHNDLFKEGNIYIEEAWKVFSVLLEASACITDLKIVNYNLLGETIKIERADILKKLEELEIENPNELKNILSQIE